MSKFSTPKLVADPILGLIDISNFLPMIDVKEFQSLAFKYQLGLSLFLFPSATHSRKQHCFGAFERTKNLMHHWLKVGMVTSEQADLLSAYALYHDIGHGPFSHMVEPLFDLTYNAPYDPETACIDPRNFCIPNLGLKGNDLYLLEGKRDRS